VSQTGYRKHFIEKLNDKIQSSKLQEKRYRLLYVIDSICKHIGQIYIPLFSPNIAELFIDVYLNYSRPEFAETKEKLRVLRKSWVLIFDDQILNSIRNKI